MSLTPPQFRTFNLPHGACLCSWRARETNLGWLLVDQDHRAVAIDIPDAGALLRVLEIRGLRLTDVVFTHAHHDHIDRVPEVLQETGCRAWGAATAPLPVPVLPLSDGDRLTMGGWSMQVMDTSGHSPVDLSFYLPELGLCFCGDTVFDGGVGRMFAGPPETYWASLLKIRALPDATTLCMGHTYAQDNYRFACSILPDCPEMAQREREAVCRAPSFRFPVQVGDQCRGNLFFRSDEPVVAEALGLSGSSPSEVFRELRERKNQF